VIERCRPKSYGKGHLNAYRFLALDAPDLLLQHLEKRGHHEPLSRANPRGSFPVQNDLEKGSERVHSEPQKGSKSVQNRLLYI
jgi:hypothetical protein